MQKTLVALQKKEQYAKKTLLDSQIKWTNFSCEIVRNCKELIFALETSNIAQFMMIVNQNQVIRNVEQIKQKIIKYDTFLQNNIKELSAKGINMQTLRQNSQQSQ